MKGQANESIPIGTICGTTASEDLSLKGSCPLIEDAGGRRLASLVVILTASGTESAQHFSYMRRIRSFWISSMFMRSPEFRS
jgi:hypothetical protein